MKKNANQIEASMYSEACEKLREKFTLDGIEYTVSGDRYYSDNGYGKKRISKVEWEAALQNRVYAEVNNG